MFRLNFWYRQFPAIVIVFGVNFSILSNSLLANHGHGHAAPAPAAGGHHHGNAGAAPVHVGGFSGGGHHVEVHINSGFPSSPSIVQPQFPAGGQSAVVNSSPISSPSPVVRHHNPVSGVPAGGGPQAGGFTSSHQPALNLSPSVGAVTTHHFANPVHSNPVHANHGQVNSGHQGHGQGTRSLNGDQTGVSASPAETSHAGHGHHHFDGTGANSAHHHLYDAGGGNAPAFYRHGKHLQGNWDNPHNHTGNHHHPGGHKDPVQSNRSVVGSYPTGYIYRPVGWGSVGTGYPSLVYDVGYFQYWNPYYSSVDLSGSSYNYTQPIPAPTSVNVVRSMPAKTAAGGSNLEEAILDAAVGAFQRSDLELALDTIEQGISWFPDDSTLHEFRALVLFAKGDYQLAAATIHTVLSAGPGWNWATLISLYRDPGTYTNQLRVLEAAAKQDPQNGALRFLLAYHYLTAGYPDAAARQLRRVVALEPNDRVAADLLKMISAPVPESDLTVSNPTPQPPVTEVSLSASNRLVRPAVPVDPSDLIGTWNADRRDGAKFVLTLTKDNAFVWKFTLPKQPAQSLEGTYDLDGNLITLNRKGGGLLVAEITPSGRDQFNFRLTGAPASDPGLDFAK